MDYRRNFQPGGTFFFTAVTYQRAHIFAHQDAIVRLREVVQEVKTLQPFRMEAWVILPDHLHMIWTLPQDDADFSSRWSRIKSQFSRRWLKAGGQERAVSQGKANKRQRGVWQPRFYEHTIRDDDDFVHHVEYMHYNLAKHGYVDCPVDWPDSSFHEYVRRGIYPANWCCVNEADVPKWAKDLGYITFE